MTHVGQDGREETAQSGHVISSASLRELGRALVPPLSPGALAAANALQYRDFLTVVLIVPEEGKFHDNWIYVHDPTVKVGRIQNFKSWSPEMVPDPKMACYGLEYFCFEGDGLWSSSDEELLERGKREMNQLGLLDASNVVDGCVVRQRKAYPVYDDRYAANVTELRREIEARFPGLYLVGRNGMPQVQQPRSRDDDRDLVRQEHSRRSPPLRPVGRQSGRRISRSRRTGGRLDGKRPARRPETRRALHPVKGGSGGTAMAKAFGRQRLIAICLCVLTLSVLLRHKTLAPVTGATLRFFSPVEQPVQLPFSAPSPESSVLEFSLHIHKSALTPTWFIILPDDHLQSITVNGVVASLAGVDRNNWTTFRAGSISLWAGCSRAGTIASSSKCSTEKGWVGSTSAPIRRTGATRRS